MNSITTTEERKERAVKAHATKNEVRLALETGQAPPPEPKIATSGAGKAFFTNCPTCHQKIKMPTFLSSLELLEKNRASTDPTKRFMSTEQMMKALSASLVLVNKACFRAAQLGYMTRPFGERVNVFGITPAGVKTLNDWRARGFSLEKDMERIKLNRETFLNRLK